MAETRILPPWAAPGCCLILIPSWQDYLPNGWRQSAAFMWAVFILTKLLLHLSEYLSGSNVQHTARHAYDKMSEQSSEESGSKSHSK